MKPLFIYCNEANKRYPYPRVPFFPHGMALGKGQMGTVKIVGLPHCGGAQIRLSPLYRRVGPGHRVGEGLGVKRY